MRYFITGGTGFIGAYVMRQLVEQGQEVTAYDLAPDYELIGELLSVEQRSAVRVIAGDVADLSALSRALKDSGARRVIHLAALLGTRSNDNPPLSLKVNCGGTINLFESARESGVERVVWASSVGVFGLASKRLPGPVANDAPHRPTDLYGACKALNENFSKHYRRVYRLNCIGLRYSLVYGYGRARTLARGTGANFMEELIDKPAKGIAATVPAGEALLDFIHVEDAARATVLASAAPESKPVAINIGGFRHTLREAAAMVSSVLPTAPIIVEPGSWNGVDHHYDLSAAEATIGYKPSINLKDGLEDNLRQLLRRQMEGDFDNKGRKT